MKEIHCTNSNSVKRAFQYNTPTDNLHIFAYGFIKTTQKREEEEEVEVERKTANKNLKEFSFKFDFHFGSVSSPGMKIRKQK